MTSSSSSTAGLTTPPPSIEFNPPTHVAADGTIIEPSKQPITIFDPSEWVIHIQSCVTKMREDLGHQDGLNPQIIQAHNAFAVKLDEAYDILKSDAADVDEQIRNRYISIVNSGSKLSADLYTNLVSVRRRVSDKLKMLAVLQERLQETATAFERFMSSNDKGKETARTTPAPSATATASTSRTQGDWERFLNELRPLLLGRRETARRPPMKAPDAFDGTYSKLRPWWGLVEDYMEIHEPTMPTESIQIKFVGSLLRDEARRWYDTRKRAIEIRNERDSWNAFSKALLERFTDRQERRRDYHDHRLKALRYEGSIQEYLSRLEELNGRVGVSGLALRDIIFRQLTPEMIRTIFHKTGSIPEDDEALIQAVREAGTLEEELLRAQGYMKGFTQRKPADSNQPNPEQTQSGDKKPRRRGRAKRPKDFSHLTKLWDNPKAAFQGVSFEETKKHKDMGRDCHRCGHNGHHLVHCRSGKTVGGTILLPYPGKKAANDTASGTKSANTAATKRKRTATKDNSDSEQPPAQRKRTAAIIASASQPPIWASSDDEISDF